MIGRGRKRGVHVGRDGWLFWLGERGQIADIYAASPVAAWSLWRWRRLIRSRARRCAVLDARYIQLFAPDKFTVCADLMGAPIVDARRSPARRFASQTAVVDLVAPLTAAGCATYLRTDTHWSHAGYLIAYRTFCAALGVEPAGHVLEAVGVARPQLCDLGVKLEPPETEQVAFPDFPRHAVRREANALTLHREALIGAGLAPGLLVGSRIVLENRAQSVDPRRLVLFGDSYAFHETGLGAMLAESFAEVHLLWSAGIDWAYVEGVRPGVVIHELAERFMARVPADKFRVPAGERPPD